jgi:hypothetical protein
MLYSIINPSDPYTVEATRLDVAAVASLILGNGQYAFEPLDGSVEIPLFGFMKPEERDNWFVQNCKMGMEATIKDVRENYRTEMADCLDSVIVGQPHEREPYLAGLALLTDPDEREKYWHDWQDKRRSSFNDIAGRAHRTAKKFREDIIAIEPVPQQVFRN